MKCEEDMEIVWRSSSTGYVQTGRMLYTHNMNKPAILLHICCAPCGSASVERLIDEGYHPILFYSNSNIHPREEYEKRLDSVRILARETDTELLTDTYDHDAWLHSVSQLYGYSREPEGGRRCAYCFRFSLDRSIRKAEELGIEFFTTTLTISPHKDSKQIFSIGKDLEREKSDPAGPSFLDINFKKKEGFKRSIELSKEYDLYRQKYCGCEFSLKWRPVKTG